jgi:hypothetical protein
MPSSTKDKQIVSITMKSRTTAVDIEHKFELHSTAAAPASIQAFFSPDIKLLSGVPTVKPLHVKLTDVHGNTCSVDLRMLKFEAPDLDTQRIRVGCTSSPLRLPCVSLFAHDLPCTID